MENYYPRSCSKNYFFLKLYCCFFEKKTIAIKNYVTILVEIKMEIVSVYLYLPIFQVNIPSTTITRFIKLPSPYWFQFYCAKRECTCVGAMPLSGRYRSCKTKFP